jgi:hypothetical protein
VRKRRPTIRAVLLYQDTFRRTTAGWKMLSRVKSR